MAELEAQVARRPDDVDAWLRLGWARYGADHPIPAEQAFERAAALRPDDPEPPFGLGLALKRQVKKEPAIRAFRRAADLTPSLTDRARASILRRLALGHINYLERGEWDLEREVWGRA
jgi:Flp pilus assembly protein TadD